MTSCWDVVPTRVCPPGTGERSWFLLVLLLGLAGGVAATAHGLAPTGGLGGTGPAFVGLAGLAAAGGDDDVGRLVRKIERFRAGEDVDFESDREDEVGDLYDAVGSLAASAGGGDQSGRQTAEAELERHVEFTDAMLDAVDDVFYVLDEDGYHQRWNETLTDVLGYTDDEIAEMHALELFPEDEHQKVSAAIRAAFETGNAQVEATYVTADGGRIPYEFVASTLECPDGNRVLAGIGRDISERVERERRLEAIVENTANPIYIKDREGVYEFANEAAADMLGMDVGEVIGKTDTELFDEESAARTHEVDERVMETGESVTEEAHHPVDGETRVFLDNKYPYRDEAGEIVGVMGISKDITERKERESELERQATMLDSLFEQLPVNIYVKDEEGRHVRTSAAHLDDDYPDEEAWFQGKTDLEIYPEELAEKTHADDMRVIEEGEPILDEEEYNPLDEEWVLTSKVPWRDEDGEIRGLIGLSQHITEQKERERELRETKQRLELVLEGTNTGIWEWDLRTDEVAWNDTFERMLGLETGEFEGTYEAFERRVHPDDVDRVTETVQRAVEENELYQTEFRLRHEDGHWVWVGARGRVVFDEEGHRRMVGINNDITERKEREREVRETNERLNAIIEASPDAIVALDLEGTVERWNPAAERIFGWSEDEVLGEPMPAVLPDHAEEFRAFQERIRDGESIRGFEMGRSRKDGERIDVSLSAAPLRDQNGEVVGSMAVLKDITERKERERELQETKRRLELALEGTNAGVYEWDPETDDVIWNETFERMMGIEPGGFEGTYEAFARRVHPADLSRVEEDLEQAVENDDLYQTEFRLRHEDDHWIWVVARGQFVDDGDGGGRMVGINYDITERKRREAQVRERERELERYREYTENVLDAIDDVFYLVDEELDLQRWNESLAAVTGYADDEIREMNVRDFFAPADADRIVAALEDIENRIGEPLESAVRTKSGESIPFEFVAAPLEDPDGNEVVAGIGRDISERKEKERQLSRLIDNVPGYVYRSDAAPPWQTRFVSEGIRDIAGYDPAALESGSVNWDEDVIAERNEEMAAEIQRAVDERESFHLVYPIDTADGDRRWVKEQGRGVYAADGSVTAIEGVVIDVTEQRTYERELERTSDLLDRTQHMASVAGWELDMQQDPPETTWTEEMYQLHGMDRGAEISFEDILSSYHPDDREDVRRTVESSIENGTGYDIEARMVTQSGDTRWVRAMGDAIHEDGEVVKFRGAIQDITEQKERQAELERTKDLLQQAGRIAGIGGWELDVTTDPPEMSWTDELYAIHGVEPGTDVDVEMVVGLYHPEDREYIQNRFEAAIERGEGYDMEVRLDSTGDRHRWVRALGEPVYEDGEVTRLRGSIQDVTDQKEREQELRSTKDRLQQFIETSPVGVVAVDPDGTVTLWNEGMEQIFGWSEDEVLGADPLAGMTGPETAAGSLRERVLGGEPFSQVELEQERKDGERIDVSVSAAPVRDESGEVTEVVAFIEDITERKERERELERTKDMLAQAQQLAGVGGWELDVTTDPPGLTWTGELYRIHGLEPGTDVGVEEALDFYHPEDRDRIADAVDRIVENGGSYDVEARIQAADGEQRWVRTIGKAIQEDGETVTVRGAFQDITDQKERELALESLHEATRGLLHTESEREVADLVVETATSLFDLPGVAVYTIDEESNRLVPTAYTDAFEELSDGAPAVGVSDDTAVWNCFATGGRVVFDDAETARQSQVFGDEVDSGLLVPMGDHGVFVVATDGPRIGDETRRLAETLVATTEAAFDRLASEADLRERDAELEAQNRRLRRQIQITDIIRRVDQSLVGATSREDVESAVCDRLVESEDVAFAWIGGLDGDELVPRTWAGTGETYLDTLALDDLEGAAEPAMVTARSGEASVVGNVVEGLREDAWRRGALANDFHSVVSVPLSVDDYDHGVLAVYADEPGVFGDLERAVFAELGQSIANAINAVSAREALHSDTVVELTLGFEDPSGVLARVAREADCDVEYEGISTRSADETRLFFATTGAAADVVGDVLEDLYAVSEFRLVSESEGEEDRCLFEAAVTGPVLPSALVDQGASPRSIRATPTGMEAVVDLPTSADVREFVETLREQFPSAELASRRNVERGMGTRQQLLSSLMDELTDRQLEVLRTAYFAGFFEWPRTSTGEEVAEMLDVTQPTVNRHLRLGQQRLLAQLFDEEAPDLVAA